jgi:hypothetical protein
MSMGIRVWPRTAKAAPAAHRLTTTRETEEPKYRVHFTSFNCSLTTGPPESKILPAVLRDS